MDKALPTNSGQPAQQRDTCIERRLPSPCGLSDVFALYIADVHARLQSNPPAHVANIGCGAGWSSIDIVRAYSRARVDGYDINEASIELAWANARNAGLTDRVTFHVRDVGDGTLNGRYDLVIALACIHDMDNPVGVLKTMRRLAGKDREPSRRGQRGRVIVMDEQMGDSFAARENDTQWMMQGWSLLQCQPLGRPKHPSPGSGTVTHTGTLERYAIEAGFDSVEVLPLDNAFFQCFRLYTEH